MEMESAISSSTLSSAVLSNDTESETDLDMDEWNFDSEGPPISNVNGRICPLLLELNKKAEAEKNHEDNETQNCLEDVSLGSCQP